MSVKSKMPRESDIELDRLRKQRYRASPHPISYGRPAHHNNHMNPKPIILAHADTRSGLAIGRSFARHNIEFISAVTDATHFSCSSRYVRHRVVQVANPRSDPEKFVEQILSLAKEFGAAAILPVTDPAVGALNAARDQARFFFVPTMDSPAPSCGRPMVPRLVLCSSKIFALAHPIRP